VILALSFRVVVSDPAGDAAQAMTLVDLTHPFAEPMPGYPGDPPVKLAPIAEMEGCPLYQVTTGMHVGTHMDAPLHLLPSGATIADLPLAKCVGRGVLIDARGRDVIDGSFLTSVALQRGDIVLVLTGFSSRFHQPAYYRDYPEVSASFADALVAAGASILGLDTPSPDRAPYQIHHTLLAAGVLIVENLTNLETLLHAPEFEVIALPVKFQAEAAPARVIERIP
jgi:kynurenine formamidase